MGLAANSWRLGYDLSTVAPCSCLGGTPLLTDRAKDAKVKDRQTIKANPAGKGPFV